MTWDIGYSGIPEGCREEFRRREAEAVASITKVVGKTAHDYGDGATISHCPICGSGAITGRSDGSIQCSFCHTCFTVQVQPAHPSMPQTVDGQPYRAPDLPQFPGDDLSGVDDRSVNTQVAYRTSTGQRLDEDSYVAHLVNSINGKHVDKGRD